MKTSKIILAALFALSFAATSCRKDNDEDLQFNTRSATDNAKAENSFNDVFKQASDGIAQAKETVEGDKNSYSPLAGNVTLTITPYDLTTFPKTITLDFGPTNVMGNDGNFRRGKIIVVTTGWYRDSATVITVTPEDYYVNDNYVQGQETLTNKGHNAAGHLNYDLEIAGTVTTTDGIVSWNSSRNNEWIEGESTTLNPWDDVYLVSGSAYGTNAANEDYTINITIPLRVQADCRWITQGSMVLVSGTFEISIDYGNGTCDNEAVVTFNGQDYTIIMG